MMRFTLNQKDKLVEVWCDKEVPASDIEKIRDQFRGLKQSGYRLVIYSSGEEDLFETLLSLLLHNRDLDLNPHEPLNRQIALAEQIHNSASLPPDNRPAQNSELSR